MGTGQANVRQDNRQLRNLIHRGKLTPGVIVSHELDLDQAVEGYQHVDNYGHRSGATWCPDASVMTAGRRHALDLRRPWQSRI